MKVKQYMQIPYEYNVSVLYVYNSILTEANIISLFIWQLSKER